MVEPRAVIEKNPSSPEAFGEGVVRVVARELLAMAETLGEGRGPAAS